MGKKAAQPTNKREYLQIPPERWPTIERAMRIKKIAGYKKNAWYVDILFDAADRICQEEDRHNSRLAR